MDGAPSKYGEEKCMQVVTGGRPKGRRPFRRPRHRWENNIKIYSLEDDEEEWSGLVWLRIGKSGELLCMR
jgi:hypothetical protein